MGLFNFFSSRTTEQKALTATGEVLAALQSRQFSALPTLGGSQPDYGRINALVVEVQNAAYGWIYRYSPPARTVIEYIARNAAQLDVKLFERVDDDHREHAGDHPAARSIRQPNPTTPGSHFIFALFIDYLTFDNAYALKVPQPNGDVQLYNLSPANVGILGRNYFQAEGYRIWNPYSGLHFDVEPERILHWRGHNPDKPRQGESKLETLREELAADRAALAAVSELHRSGLSLQGWLERPADAPPMSPEALERLRESAANWAKSSNRRPPVFEEGMAWKTGGVTPEDAEFIASRTFTREYVASLYGLKNVPPQTDEERKQFYADVLPPFCEACTAFLNLHILQAEYGRDDLYFEFSNEKVMDEVYKTLTSASGRPVLLTNEARAKLDLPPVDTGDELITPANVIVGDNPLPSQGVMPIQNPNGPPQDGSHRSGEADMPMAAGQRSLEKRVPIAPLLNRAHARRNEWAAKYTSVVRRNFERQERRLKSKGYSAKAWEVRWDEELAGDLNALYTDHIRTEGDLQGFRLNFLFDPGQTVNWLKAKADGTAKAINDGTQKALVEAASVKEVFDYAKDHRAEALGMAMATDIAGFAVKEATRQAPGERLVTVAGGDCEVCAPYQGTWAASDLDAWPAYHENCNCVAAPS